MKLIQSSETRKKRLATGVLLFITVLLIVWTALPWILLLMIAEWNILTKEEWKYLHKGISQLTSTIWANTYTIIGKEEAEKMIIFNLFPLVSLGKWIIGITLIGFLIGYFMRRYGSIFAFLIGSAMSIYRVVIHIIRMTTPPTEVSLLLVLVFVILIWAGFGLGFIGYGAAILGGRIREGEKPFLSKRELTGIGIISVFTFWLVLIGIVLPPYYPPRLHPQIYTIFDIYAYLSM